MLKISLLFDKFKKYSRINSRTLRIKNAKCSGYCFYINTSIQGDFQSCISVPLRNPICLVRLIVIEEVPFEVKEV